MRIGTIILLTSLLFTYGCSSGFPKERIVGPEPTHSEYTISVTIDSIPSGADVYAIEKDGLLGEKIGTTPFMHNIGIAPQYVESIYDSGYTHKGVEKTFSWGKGAQWENVPKPGGSWPTLFLNIALAKGDRSLAVVSKEIFSGSYGGNYVGDEFRDKNIALTVPLKTIAEVNRELQSYRQQQAPNSQQNITIQQQKDDLDSINSALDALIKLHALGAFNQ